MDLVSECLQRLGAAGVTRTNEGFECECPFCRNDKRTFRIALRSSKSGKNSGRAGAWKCHRPNCQAFDGGYIESLVMKAFRLDWHRSCAMVESRGLSFVREEDEEDYEPEEIDEARVYPHVGKHSDYLVGKRGLYQADLDYYRIGYSELADQVIIPNFSVENELVGLTTRPAKKVGRYTHSEYKKSEHLYGLYEGVRDGLTRAAIVEGHLDAPGLRPHVEDDIAVVAQLGAYLSETQAKLLVQNGFEEFLLVFDNDAGGVTATLSALDQLRELGLVDIYIALYNASDPGSLNVAGGEITDIITSSRWLATV